MTVANEPIGCETLRRKQIAFFRRLRALHALFGHVIRQGLDPGRKGLAENQVRGRKDRDGQRVEWIEAIDAKRPLPKPEPAAGSRREVAWRLASSLQPLKIFVSDPHLG